MGHTLQFLPMSAWDGAWPLKSQEQKLFFIVPSQGKHLRSFSSSGWKVSWMQSGLEGTFPSIAVRKEPEASPSSLLAAGAVATHTKLSSVLLCRLGTFSFSLGPLLSHIADLHMHY